MFNSGFFATVYGLASALSWGIGDFNGGIASRRASVYMIVFISQIVGFGLLVALALILNDTVPPTGILVASGAMGFIGMVGILALYRGLAIGRMGVVAPLTALVGGVLPVIVSAFIDGLPTPLQFVGFVIALVAVWLISGTGQVTRILPGELQMALLSGVCLGVWAVFLDYVSPTSVLYPLTVARAVSSGALFVLVFAIRKDSLPPKNTLPFAVLSGIFDASGNVFFALATRAGRLDISTVVASLYPAATVLLAWLILKEKLTRRQLVGVMAALVAIILIAL